MRIGNIDDIKQDAYKTIASTWNEATAVAESLLKAGSFQLRQAPCVNVAEKTIRIPYRLSSEEGVQVFVRDGIESAVFNSPLLLYLNPITRDISYYWSFRQWQRRLRISEPDARHSLTARREYASIIHICRNAQIFIRCIHCQRIRMVL